MQLPRAAGWDLLTIVSFGDIMSMQDTFQAIVSGDPGRKIRWKDILDFFNKLDGHDGHQCTIEEDPVRQGVIYAILLDDKPAVITRYALSEKYIDSGNLRVIRTFLLDAGIWF
jgi:hypothetical protein